MVTVITGVAGIAGYSSVGIWSTGGFTVAVAPVVALGALAVVAWELGVTLPVTGVEHAVKRSESTSNNARLGLATNLRLCTFIHYLQVIRISI